MTCPNCGASVQPGDSFCVSCGHALHPADATRRLEDLGPPPYGPVGDATPDAGTPGRTPYLPLLAESPRAEKTWASGSSFPAPNPYASAGGRRKTQGGSGALPPSASRLPPVRRGGSGVLKGLGAALIALWALSHQLGHAILGLGFFKLWFVWSLFHLFMYSHLGWLVLLVILMLIAGSMRRSRMI